MTCLSELFTAAAVFVFAIGMMVNGEQGSGSDVYHADVNQAGVNQRVLFEESLEENLEKSIALNIIAAKPVAGELVDPQAIGTNTENREGSFQSLETEGSHWVILTAWQEYENGTAYPNAASRLTMLPVAAAEGYTMVAATYSFVHYSGYAEKPGEPIRVRF